MLYNGVLVSALYQSESAICIHISPYPLPLVSPSHPNLLFLFFGNFFRVFLHILKNIKLVFVKIIEIFFRFVFVYDVLVIDVFIFNVVMFSCLFIYSVTFIL